MPRVTKAQVHTLRELRDRCDVFSNYGTADAVSVHNHSLPLTKCVLVNRDDGGLFRLSSYSFMKFVTKGWLRVVESRSRRPQEQRFRWRLTEAGKRACWHKKPPEGGPDEKVIECED